MNRLCVIAALFLQGLTTIPGAGVVTGQLRSTSGQPAIGVRVGALAAPEGNASVANASALVSLSLTDSAGRFRLENVPPGRYYITAGLVDLPTYYPGVSSLNGATAVTVSPGANITGIDFQLVVPPGISVKGRVTLPSGQPPAGLQLNLIGSNGSQSTPANADGSFEFLRVRPGSYTLLVNSGTLSQPVTVVVSDKDVTGIQAVLVRTVRITGSVVVEGGGPRPLMSLTFSSFKGGSTPPAVLLGGPGFAIPEGEYRVGWTGLPAGYQVQSITSGSTDLLANSLKVSTAPIPPIVVTLAVGTPPPWVKVSGRVTGLSGLGDGVPRRVSIMGGAEAGSQDVTMNPDGSFEFSRVLPGNYAVVFIPALPVPPNQVVVPTNRDLAGVEIAIPPLKEVTGNVVVEGVTQTTPSALLFTLTGPSTSATVAADVAQPGGAFRVILPVGERRITVFAPGHSVRSFTFGSTDLTVNPLKLSDNDAGELRIVMSPAAVTGITGGVIGGVLGGVLRAVPPPPPPPPTPPPIPLPSLSAGGISVSSAVAQANLISQVRPAYPDEARAARIQGTVVLSAVISRDGAIERLSLVSGHPMLNGPAMEAVKQWRYKPMMVDGQPVTVQTTITVNFALQ